MRRIRIGNDINLKVSVTRNGKKEDFTGKTVSVFLNGPTRSFPISSFNINGNEITFSFLGSMQKDCGDYTVTVKQEWEDNQNISDTFVAFKLVERSYMAGGTDKYDVYVETIDTETNISTGEGTDDYQFLSGKPKINNVVLVGNKTLHEIGAQPEGNYALKEEIPDISGLVEKEKGKSLSSNDFTKELKQKLEDIKSGADKLGDLSNVGDWANIAPTKDRILVQLKGDVTWRSITLDSLTQTIGDVVAIKIVRSDDDVEGTDNDVFSSLRTLKEIVERSLSRKNADQAAEIIDFLKGLTVNGDKASIDKDGNATVQRLIALIKAQVAALEVTGNAKTNSLDVTETAKAKDLEVSDSVTTLNAVIQALAKTHDLTVENTADIMNGIIRQYLSSESFVSGFLGSGFKIWQDDNGLWHGELDELTVRKTFLVFELIVQKIVHQGGMVIRSAAGGKLKKVTDGGTYWKCEHDSTDDFVVGDQVLCQTFTGTSMKRYWRLVTSAGAGYFNLSKSDCETGSANPEAGDEVAVLGNRTVTARQKAQIDCAVGDDAPYRDDYSGISSYSLVNKLVCRSGNCAGIVDEVFGALDETVNFYGKGVRLRGSFALESSGKLVEDEISGQISDVRTELEVTAGQISSKVTEATVAATNAGNSATLAQGYASTASNKASAASNSANSAANVLTTVTQKETSINQTADAIELKAGRAESAAGRAESAEASINLKADGIVLQASNQAAKTAVDSVQIGGRNLVLNSIINETSNVYGFGGRWLSLIKGNTYTFSFNGHVDQQTLNDGKYLRSFLYFPDWSFAANMATTSLTDETVFTTFIAPKSGSYIINSYLYPGDGSRSGSVTVNWYKVEKGNKATDWTPAPEDVSQDASYKANVAEDNAKQYANNTFTTKTTHEAGIQILSGQIQSKVSQTDFNSLGATVSSHTSTINQLPTTIDQRITSQVADGGIIKTNVESWFTLSGNTISLGAKAFNISGATVFSSLATQTQAQGYAKTAVDGVQVGGRNLMLGSESFIINGGITIGINFIPGQQYTISIEKSVNVNPGNQSGGSMLLYCADVEPYPLRIYIPISGSKQVATFTYPTTGKGNLNLCATEAWTGLSDITKLKIEIGNKATDWTPAPEDVAQDATNKALAAQSNAISAASTDATTKVTASQTALATQLGYSSYAEMTAQAAASKTIINGGYINTLLIKAKAITSELIDVANLTVRNVEAKDSNGNVTCKINGATGDVKIKGELTVQSLRLSLITDGGSLKDGYLMLSSSGSYIAPELSDNEVMEVRFITPAWSRMVVSITLIPKNSNVRIGTTIWLLSAVNSSITISGIGSILGFKRDGITYWIISYNEKD